MKDSYIISTCGEKRVSASVTPVNADRPEWIGGTQDAGRRAAALEVFPQLERGRVYLIRVTEAEVMVNDLGGYATVERKPWDYEFRVRVEYQEVEIKDGFPSISWQG